MIRRAPGASNDGLVFVILNTAPKHVAIPVEAGCTRKEGLHTARTAVILRLMPVVWTRRGILVVLEVKARKVLA